MRNPLLSLGLVAAALCATGCTAVMGPYAGGLFGPHPVMRRHVPAATVVDPVAAVRGRWDNVMRLAPGSIVDVLTQDGLAHVGAFTAADGHSVRVMVHGIERVISRHEVLRIDLTRLPGSDAGAVAHGALRGAALGIGVAALVAVVVGGDAWPPPAAVWRGGAAIGGVAGGEAALAGRQRRMVYLAEHQQPASVRAAYSAEEWTRFVELAPETAVIVFTTSGGRYAGLFIAADEVSMRLSVGDGELRIPRESVERVEITESPNRIDGRRRSPATPHS